AAAIKAAESLFETNWNAKSGDLQRIQFQGKADELAAQLDDYAALTLASIRLYDLTFDERWYARAGALLSTMQTKFRDEDSSFFMTASLNGADGQLDLITRPKEYYDGAQPSSNSLALAALVEYYQRNGQPMLKREALETWTRLSGNALKSTGSHPIALLYGIKLNSESASSTRFAANGTVKLKVNRSANKLTVIAETKEGWHMNSSEPLQEDYIPTTLAGPDLSKITYPVASMYKPDFSDELLSVYDGATMFTSAINSNAASTATLQIQVCSNQICLPPENVSLFIPATPQ
ncbi:MAG: protein-disulfide reductase DsbD domain-containing protein, partial [Alphaproteobacteria bacterium]